MNHDNKGFTLIELMLAMTFIAFLLVAIAMTTIQISAIYNKGITLREVNQAGRAISDELQRSVSASIPFDATPKKDDSSETATSKFVDFDGGGRLCLGQYTYAWNYGRSIAGGSGVPDTLNKYSNGDTSIVRFVKVSDPNGALCSSTIATIDRANATEMLASGDRDLVIHDFDVISKANDPVTGQAIYAISMVVGTNDGEQLETNDRSCKPPAGGVGKEDYCSVNQFDIIARAGNKTGSNE